MKELSHASISFQKSCALGLQSQKMHAAEIEKSFCNDMSVRHWAQTDQQREAERGGWLATEKEGKESKLIRRGDVSFWSHLFFSISYHILRK